MRRLAVILSCLAIAFAVPGVASADHPPPGNAVPAPGEPAVNQGGGEWEMLKTLVTGNPHTDLDFFTQDGVTYASVGTLGTGGNRGGQTIVKLTDNKGNVSPDTISFVSGHPSATCISDPVAALGLQHDVEATPKGDVATNWTDTKRKRTDTQLLIDATDAPGRCHDQGTVGLVDAPQGGLEIIDVTDIENPVEIGLTSHIGEAHTVNIDPRRPHIAYAVTSDGVSVSKDAGDADGDGDKEELIRENEIAGDNDALDLDGFEVVDLSSCMNFPDGTPVQDKRDACRPEVYRYRYPSLQMSLGHKNQGTVYGCHELEIFPDDRLTCGSGAAMIMFDMSNAFDENGKPKGDPLPCKVRPSSTTGPTSTGAMVTDCVVGDDGSGGDQPLDVPAWIEIGAPSLKGVKYLGSAHHQGRQAAAGDVTSPAYGAAEDIDFDHEAELTHSGKFAIATDERGGGVLPPGSSCAPGIDNPVGNGGLHAYDVSELQKKMPDSAEEAWEPYAQTPDGDKAIVRAEIQTVPHATVCTAHVFQQIPNENRIFMAWYSQGTRVFDYKENKDGTFEWAEVAHFIPFNANQWVSHVFKTEDNGDGTTTYYGVAGDFNLGEAGRNAIDVWKATLPSVGTAFKKGRGDDESGGGGGTGGEDSGVDDLTGTGVLPATGGGAGLVPGGVALLGAAALIGRNRRRHRS